MQKKKKTYIKIFIIMLMGVVAALLFIVCKKGKKYPFTYSETSQYMPLAGGEMLELTEDGGVFRYSNTGEKVLLLESSDIQQLSVFREKDAVYTLSVHKDATLGLDKDFSFREKVIGSLKGIRKVGVQFKGIIVLTEEGEVYEGTIPRTWSDFYETAAKDVEFVKVEGLPEVVDISIVNDSVLLMQTGEVWAKGKFFKNEYEDYTRIPAEAPMVQISNAGHTILAIDEEGTVYEAGMVLDKKNYSSNNKQLTKISTYRRAVQIYGSGERAVLYDEDGTVRFFGHICRGKAAGEPWGGKVKNLKGVKQVFLMGEYIYILCENCLYIRKEPLSKRF